MAGLLARVLASFSSSSLNSFFGCCFSSFFYRLSKQLSANRFENIGMRLNISTHFKITTSLEFWLFHVYYYTGLDRNIRLIIQSISFNPNGRPSESVIWNLIWLIFSCETSLNNGLLGSNVNGKILVKLSVGITARVLVLTPFKMLFVMASVLI